ncbi:MAG: glycosyltransferase [Elusimicrobia bacterium]|nr:glycosyltransferase [Elusimicrobiota bacterium]
MMRNAIEITLPVLNEERRLENGVRRTISFMNDQGLSNVKIVIADNGSSDRTEEIGNRLCREFPGMVSFLKVPRRGVGLTLQTSWMNSEADVVGYMDVDLATDLKHLPEVVSAFAKGDVAVVAGRRLGPGAVVENRTWVREITSRGFNLLLRSMCRVKLADGMCGFKFFRRQAALDIIQAETTCEGWFFCAELLVKCKWKNLKIMEIPVHWKDDSDSRVDLLSMVYRYFRELLRLCIEKRRWVRRYAT